MAGSARALSRAAGRAAAIVVLAAALAPAAAQGKAGPPGEEGLSPRLRELASAAVRSLPPRAQARAVGLPPTGPASLVREGPRVVVEVRFDHGAAAAVDDLRATGAEVLGTSRRYQSVTVAALPGGLRSLARVPGVSAAVEALTPRTYASCTGAVVSEGDTQLHAAEAREALGLDGGGVTVGILSDSFNRDSAAATHAEEDVASGDLPGPGNPCGYTTPVGNLDDSGAGEVADEGRAMAQIVHDLAPGAAIDFATASFESEVGHPEEGELRFANNIRKLADAGASVIADDVGYFEEPFFQDGPIADAISEVTKKGVAYFTAAGNDNLIEAGTGNEISSWETPEFREEAGGECPAALQLVEGSKHCLDFDPQTGPGHYDPTFGITVEPGETLIVDLQWAEPWGGVEADLDGFLLDPATGAPLGTSKGGTQDNPLTQRPVEVVAWENAAPIAQEVDLAVVRCFDEAPLKCNPNGHASAKPRVKFILLENGRGVSKTEYPASSGEDVVGPSIFGHAGAPAAITVGAVRYSDSSVPEFYSSRGPATHYFGPVTGTSPAAPLPAPEVIAKPDVAATDCGLTTFFYPNPSKPGVFRFCGTSAAAPHAAAIAALARQANPGLTPAQISEGLRSTADPVGTYGPDAVGAGLVDARRLLGALAPPAPPVAPITITITERPPPLTRARTSRIAFTSNRSATFSCSLDGGLAAPCSSPFTTPSLADGAHTVSVTAADSSGATASAPPVSFTVDATPPATFFRVRPHRTLRRRHGRAKAVFRFGSDDRLASFSCGLDGAPPRPCAARVALRVLPGRHTMRVFATDAAGNVDPTPAVCRFRVVRVRHRAHRRHSRSHR